MNSERISIVAAVLGALLLGILGTGEIWQALTTDVIGIRAGGIMRADDPVLFWVAFAVSALIAAPMWLCVIFIVIVFILRLASTKAN